MNASTAPLAGAVERRQYRQGERTSTTERVTTGQILTGPPTGATDRRGGARTGAILALVDRVAVATVGALISGWTWRQISRWW